MTWGWFRVGLNLPYPLDADTASAVEAAQQHVLTWESLEDGEDIYQWVLDSFLAEGKTALPDDAYLLREGIGSRSTKAPAEEEVRALSQEDLEFQRFLAGEEYSNGLADVTDAEFEARHEGVILAMTALAKSGQV
jgi:hypothetical protein